jgi:mRNA interferase RelE/StbE
LASYKILIKPSAVKELKKISNSDFERIKEKIRKLAPDPRPKGCEKLSHEEKYRLRQGNYRIIYFVDDENQEITIYKIGHRREVYKR